MKQEWNLLIMKKASGFFVEKTKFLPTCVQEEYGSCRESHSNKKIPWFAGSFLSPSKRKMAPLAKMAVQLQGGHLKKCPKIHDHHLF